MSTFLIFIGWAALYDLFLWHVVLTKAQKRIAWEFIHNVVAHPLLSLTFNSRAANWLHDVTAERAFGVAKEDAK